MKGSVARRRRAAGAALAASAWVAACTACGASSPPANQSRERQFAANAAGLIDQLHQDVAISTSESGSLASARRALRSGPDLLAMLVAYTDFGSCRQMVRNAGTTSADRRFRRVQTTLGSACGFLEQAANLFTVAATRSDARALVAASQATTKASPLLFRAKLELDAATRSVR